MLVELLSDALKMAKRSEGLIVFPTFLIKIDALPSREHDGIPPRIEDRVLSWVCKNGLQGDRTKKDFQGYPKLLRELFESPPWVEVHMDDVDGDISSERALELRPLYLHCSEAGYGLLRRYQEYLQQKNSEQRELLPGHLFKSDVSADEACIVLELLASPLKEHGIFFESDLDPLEMEMAIMNTLLLLELRDRIQFVQTLGQDTVERIYWTIFEANLIDGVVDDMYPVPGAPDILIWSSDPQRPFWSFMEVKGPGDRLRDSQHMWIHTNWGDIEGRFILLTISRT